MTQPRKDSEQTLTAPGQSSNEKVDKMASPNLPLNDTQLQQQQQQGQHLPRKPVEGNSTGDVLPRIPLDLTKHAIPISIAVAINMIGSCFLPILLYFLLKYVAKATPPIYVGVSTAPFGVSTLYGWFTRLYRLTRSKDNEFYRPLGSRSKWELDLFHWNFTASFLIETAVIVVSVALPPRIKHPFTGGVLPRMTACALVFLVANLSLQMIIFHFIIGVRTPVAISSVRKGQPARPALYTIIEDVVAVDGKQGATFRRAFDERYRASPDGLMQKMLTKLGLIWGISGLSLTALLCGLIFSPSVTSHDAAWVIGFTVPYGWVAIMVVFTVWYVKKCLRREWALASAGTV